MRRATHTLERDVAAPRLDLLGGFCLSLGGRQASLPTNAQRVLAFLSIGPVAGAPRPRTMLAERLWIDSPVSRAQGNLRTALWRIRQVDPRLLVDDRDHLGLGRGVRVDLHASLDQAERLIGGAGAVPAEDARPGPLTQELLPGWDDDWLLLERERVRQLHLHALEALSRRMLATGVYSRAVEAALAAVACEPLRESAHCVLIAAHLAEGNVVEAHRHYRHFTRLLWHEMRLSPSRSFDQMVAAAQRA